MKIFFYATLLGISGIGSGTLYAMNWFVKEEPELGYYFETIRREEDDVEERSVIKEAIFSRADARFRKRETELPIIFSGRNFINHSIVQAFLGMVFTYKRGFTAPGNNHQRFENVWVLDCRRLENEINRIRKKSLEEGLVYGACLTGTFFASGIGAWWLWNRFRS